MKGKNQTTLQSKDIRILFDYFKYLAPFVFSEKFDDALIVSSP